MGVADRTLKTFDYISKGLLPLDDSLSRSEEETLEEQILDCCVREEWEEAEVTLAARTWRQGAEGGLRKRKDSEDAARGFGVVSKRKVLSYVIAVTDENIGCFLYLYFLRNLLCGFYLLAVRCLCLNTLTSSSRHGRIVRNEKHTERTNYICVQHYAYAY